MKNLKLKDYIIFALVLAVVVLWAGSALSSSKSNKKIAELRNQLAEVQGSIEIADGVQYRLAQEIRFKESEISDLLGENTKLEDAARELEGRIATLTQINASLREDLRFSSNNENSNATTTVIETTCPDTPDAPTPNIRVDFDLEQLGFRAAGFTETNPSYAELSLTQQTPFVIDLALNQDNDGVWSAIAAEQQERLYLDIGELVINPRRIKEMWYEKFGLGVATTVGLTHFSVGPAIQFEGRRSDFGFRYEHNLINGDNFGGFNITFRPFRRRR